MIGRKRHRLTYMQKNITRNEFNEEVVKWVKYADIWASVEPFRGREYWESRQVQSEVTHKIRHRYIVGIQPEMEIHWQDRVFEILHYFDVDERRKEMEVHAKERL